MCLFCKKVLALDLMFIAVKIYWSCKKREKIQEKKQNLRVKINFPEPDKIALPSHWLSQSILYKINAIIFEH